MIAPGEPRCYAIRRVNPFLGVMQIIETDQGRALSSNGLVWDLQVHISLGGGWGSLNQDRNNSGFCRYGLWSADEGLVKRPLAPDFDDAELTRTGDELVSIVSQAVADIPFNLADSLELWLLDAEGAPLALLDSRLPGSAKPSPEPRRWHCSLSGEGLASQRRYPQAAPVESLVKQRAGFNIHKHWVERQTDGSGLIREHAQTLAAEEFPALLLSRHWPKAEQRELVEGYFAWVAPTLLTLQGLEQAQRAWLERQLHVQAQSLEHHWRLYPEVIDPLQLKAARVQLRLQQSLAGGGSHE
ncbi:MAG: hypothetical protein HQL47_09280 [Gammaproteobacteria bacterium]|nr:hypothetical protein [Gammaproteobacteria bacterium]